MNIVVQLVGKCISCNKTDVSQPGLPSITHTQCTGCVKEGGINLLKANNLLVETVAQSLLTHLKCFTVMPEKSFSSPCEANWMCSDHDYQYKMDSWIMDGWIDRCTSAKFNLVFSDICKEKLQQRVKYISQMWKTIWTNSLSKVRSGFQFPFILTLQDPFDCFHLIHSVLLMCKTFSTFCYDDCPQLFYME